MLSVAMVLSKEAALFLFLSALNPSSELQNPAKFTLQSKPSWHHILVRSCKD